MTRESDLPRTVHRLERSAAVALVRPVCGNVAALDPAIRARRAAFPVALVTMPFALSTRPSLQLGLLAEIARTHGFPITTLHLNLDLVRRIGVERYHHLACTRNPMFGDWLFSVAAFADDAPDPAGTMPEDLHPLSRETLEVIAMSADELRELRNTVIPAYLDELMAGIDWSRYRVVGFTSTFQQNVASFALARRIKTMHPHIVTLFGGANFDGPMGPAWMQAIPWIDLAVSGEADRAFADVLRVLSDGGDALVVPGVLGRRNSRFAAGPPGVPFEDLDALPVPDYREYFERATRLQLLAADAVRKVDLPFESSRGCWWGEKATCRFCGLNGSTMAYRSKSPERVLLELETLARRHHSLAFNAADNILDPNHLRTVMAPLAAANVDYWIFYEAKANLGRDELRLLHRAGVRALQPGIESLSSHVLRLMLKGTKAATNVNLLRWARYYGIETYWNVLLGFPGETVKDYDGQAQLARQIVHLDPPGGFVRIGLERFSPYFENPAQFPVRGGRAVPEPGYTHTYPRHVDLASAAYHFAGELEGSLPDDAYGQLVRALGSWHDRSKAAERPSLTFWWAPGLLHIEDRRSALAPVNHRFDDPHAAIYAACSEGPISLPELGRRLDIATDAITSILADFCRLGLMMRDGGLHLALALPGSPGR